MKSNECLIDFWYAERLPIKCTSLSDAIENRYGKSFRDRIFRNRFLRVVLFCWLSRHYEVAVPNWPLYGRTACILSFILRRKNLVLLEVIDFANLHKPTNRTKILTFLTKFAFGPAMRSSVRSMQVMSQWEKQHFHEAYGIPLFKISVTLWPLNWNVTSPAKVEAAQPYVFASGRAGCDWPTLYQAALKSSWPYHIVCTHADAAKIVAMDDDRRRVKISWDIPEAEHNAIMASAAVCVISLEERYASTGQIRLGTAIALGVPVVASDVKGLEGYLIDDVTAKAVPAGDPSAMAKAIDQLMSDPHLARCLAARATAYAHEETPEKYFYAVGGLIEAAAAGRYIEREEPADKILGHNKPLVPLEHSPNATSGNDVRPDQAGTRAP